MRVRVLCNFSLLMVVLSKRQKSTFNSELTYVAKLLELIITYREDGYMDMLLDDYAGLVIGLDDTGRVYEESFYTTVKSVLGLKLDRSSSVANMYRSLVVGYDSSNSYSSYDSYNLGYDSITNKVVIELLGRTMALANHSIAHSIDPDDVSKIDVKKVTADFRGFYIHTLARVIVYYIENTKNKDISRLESLLKDEEEILEKAKLDYRSEESMLYIEQRVYSLRDEIYYKTKPTTFISFLNFLRSNGLCYDLNCDEVKIATKLKDYVNSQQIQDIEYIDDIELKRFPTISFAQFITSEFFES